MSALATRISDVMDAQTAAFEVDVLAGLEGTRKTLPSRWLYDDYGSELFEQITVLPEYYPTRTEAAILKTRADQLAEFCGERAVVIEYGAGASVKSEILLRALATPRMYVPIDIAGDFLSESAGRLKTRFQGLEIFPIAADFTSEFDLPGDVPAGFARTGRFLGSTIGNLDHGEALAFLKRINRHLRTADTDQSGRALIGIDLRKSTDILIAAYDDDAGVTAAFNVNLLTRINRELGGTFNQVDFRHEARWNESDSAIEMHLVAVRDRTVSIGSRTFKFEKDETIHTESSRKYSVRSFTALAEEAGWQTTEIWTDENNLFAIVGLESA